MKPLPSSRSARSFSVPEMALILYLCCVAVRRCAGLLHDNHRCGAKSIVPREGAFFGNLSVK
jgi:hypothetical protein